MSQESRKAEGLLRGIVAPYSGKIGSMVFQKNGRVRIDYQTLVKRKSTK